MSTGRKLLVVHGAQEPDPPPGRQRAQERGIVPLRWSRIVTLAADDREPGVGRQGSNQDVDSLVGRQPTHEQDPGTAFSGMRPVSAGIGSPVHDPGPFRRRSELTGGVARDREDPVEKTMVDLTPHRSPKPWSVSTHGDTPCPRGQRREPTRRRMDVMGVNDVGAPDGPR